MKNISILKSIIRDLLLSEGKYHLHKNKRFKTKKNYNRKLLKKQARDEIKNNI